MNSTTMLDALMSESAMTAQEWRLNPERVADALWGYYGLAGELSRISTEKDDTFLLEPTDPGPRHLIKISSSYEDPTIVDLQSSVLEHIEQADPGLPIPRLMRTLEGHRDVACFTGPGPYSRVLRVLSYLEGTPLGYGPTSLDQRLAVGRTLARLSHALHGFEHPRSQRLLAWDIRNFPQLAPLLDYVENAELRVLIAMQLDIYASRIEPLLPSVRQQVVHNDLNRFNILTTTRRGKELSGIIDFGDVVHTALPFDVAIAASGFLSTAATDPWAEARDMIRGYLNVRTLNEAEREVALLAAPVRIAIRTLLTSYQSAINPERGDYLNSHMSDNISVLRAVSTSVPPVL